MNFINDENMKDYTFYVLTQTFLQKDSEEINKEIVLRKPKKSINYYMEIYIY